MMHHIEVRVCLLLQPLLLPLLLGDGTLVISHEIPPTRYASVGEGSTLDCSFSRGTLCDYTIQSSNPSKMGWVLSDDASDGIIWPGPDRPDGSYIYTRLIGMFGSQGETSSVISPSSPSSSVCTIRLTYYKLSRYATSRPVPFSLQVVDGSATRTVWQDTDALLDVWTNVTIPLTDSHTNMQIFLIAESLYGASCYNGCGLILTDIITEPCSPTTTTPEPITTTTTTPEQTTTTPEAITTTTTTPEETITAPEPTTTTPELSTTELGTVSNNQASCRTTGADVTVTLPSSMRDDDVILYVADSEGRLYDQCQYKFTGQQVAAMSGRLTVTVDYLACRAHITDEWLTLNSSLVAALQHSHSEQMFSIYHIYCHVARVNDKLDSEQYTVQETEGSRYVISETLIDDVTNDNDVTFTMVVVDVDDVIVADDDLAITITSDPVVPFKVYDCSMVSSVIDDVRVTILDDNGCESNGARSNVTYGLAEITFPVKQIPFVDQVYFSCYVSTCVMGNCAQSECSQSDHHVDVIREVSDVGAAPVQGVTINLLTPHFTIYKS